MNNRIEIKPGRRLNITTYINPMSEGTVFLIHGLGGRSQQWNEQIPLLKKKYTLIIPDLYGHGDSDKPSPSSKNPYDFTEHDLDMHALFTRYASERNIIIGHSYGGALAASLTVDHQDSVSQLILVSPIACEPSLKIPAVYHLPAFILECVRPLLEKQFVRLAFDPSANKMLIKHEMQASNHNRMSLIKAMINGTIEIPRLDITMLATPTLILLGESDKLVPPSISEKFYQSLPHHQFALIQHAGHMMQLEQPHLFNQLISRFLSIDSMATTGLMSAS